MNQLAQESLKLHVNGSHRTYVRSPNTIVIEYYHINLGLRKVVVR